MPEPQQLRPVAAQLFAFRLQPHEAEGLADFLKAVSAVVKATERTNRPMIDIDITSTAIELKARVGAIDMVMSVAFSRG